MAEKLLSIKDLTDMCGLARSTIYRSLGAGLFPQPVRIARRTVRWRQADVDAWLASLQPSTHAPACNVDQAVSE